MENDINKIKEKIAEFESEVKKLQSLAGKYSTEIGLLRAELKQKTTENQ